MKIQHLEQQLKIHCAWNTCLPDGHMIMKNIFFFSSKTFNTNSLWMKTFKFTHSEAFLFLVWNIHKKNTWQVLCHPQNFLSNKNLSVSLSAVSTLGWDCLQIKTSLQLIVQNKNNTLHIVSILFSWHEWMSVNVLFAFTQCQFNVLFAFTQHSLSSKQALLFLCLSVSWQHWWDNDQHDSF